MRRLTTMCILTTATAALLMAVATADAQPAAKKKQKRPPNPAFAKVIDDPKLPRVLLIGDSISIGYTAATRELLKGKANLHRIPTNGGPTTRGLQNIDKWLGDGKWDVIHFNWGLHDLKYIKGKHQVPLGEYEKNLTKLVQRLIKTKATLIWCNTTPVPEGVSPLRKNAEVLEFNKAAVRVMAEYDLRMDDLYTFAYERLEKIQRPKNVHFTPAGSKLLAQQVSKTILAALQE